MFGRRRHRAPLIVAPPAPAPLTGVELTEEQLFEKIRARLDQQVGTNGDWTLVRRSDADTDTFFHEMAAFSLAREVTAAIVGKSVASAEHSEDSLPAPATIITVQTVPAGNSGLTDLDLIFADVTPAAVAGPAPVNNTTVLEHVMFELNTVAVWADPQRHDPSQVDAEMVTPTGKKRPSASRAS